jgi:hypothetical protein
MVEHIFVYKTVEGFGAFPIYVFYWYVPRTYSFQAENWVQLPMELK